MPEVPNVQPGQPIPAEQVNDAAAVAAKGGAPMSTSHSATVDFTNNWGSPLVSVTVRHLLSNDINKSTEYTWTSVAEGQTTGNNLAITFETGFNADFDYWWVSFTTLNGDTYQSKSSFYCNLTSSDIGGTVTASVDGQQNNFEINPPVSSSCTTSQISQN